jgi:hypothetical protein
MEVHASELGGSVSGNLAALSIGVEDLAFTGENQDGVGGVFGKGLEVSLGRS